MGMTIRKKEVVKYRDEEHKVPLVLYEIIVDRVGELPANPIVEGEEIAQGSRCWVIESAIWYGYTSIGKWINQKDGGAAPVLIEKTITENGTYDASADNADGYSKVTVDVAGGSGETFEVNGTVTDDGFILSKTYEEIKTAILENKKPVLTIAFGDDTIICNICTYTGNMIVFLRETVIEEGLISQILVYISPENYHIQNTTSNIVIQAIQAELNE